MRRLLPLLVLFLACANLQAQPKGRVPPNFLNPAQLNKAEGQEVMEKFRNSHPAGDYSLLFELRDTTATGSKIFYNGQLWGTWNSSGPVSRIAIKKEQQRVEYISQNGTAPRIWRELEGTDKSSIELTQADYTKPLMDAMQFTPFELQMPFIYWNDYIYEGSDRVKGRPAYTFILYPPEGALLPLDLAAVRITVDADFNALLKAETLDSSGKTLKSFRILSFKKVEDTWLVKAIDLVDERTHAKTRFTVIAAAVMLHLDEALFVAGTTMPENTPPRTDFVFFE